MENLRTSEIRIDLQPARPKPLSAYLVRPAGPGTFPGVVVIHEIFGLNANIRDVAERFAQDGYAALAVDLFSSGSKVVCMARIVHGLLFRTLENGVVSDLQAALDFLGSQPEVIPERLGAIGFCMGGSYALQLACVSGDMRAASIFYSMNPRPLEAVAGACPIAGSFPERDPTARAGRALEAALKKTTVPHDIKIYPEARHSFFNDRGRAYHPEAAADAWDRTLAFFEENLR
jgi:carboxymethylenebutenolidase